MGALKSLVLILTLAVLLAARAAEQFDLRKLSQLMSQRYGEQAALRFEAWRKLIDKQEGQAERTQLLKVNAFFNLFDFVDDIDHWGAEDYWATPVEFIGTRGGDCEDFTIAKYFTLIELGVPDEKLRLTYVKATTLNQFHMVLAYYPTPSAMPLILDNIDPELKPANLRRDLIPIYSFNGQKLWLNKQKGRGQLAGNAERLSRWQDLRQRYQLNDLIQNSRLSQGQP